METYTVKQKDLKGDIKNFPIEVVQKMVDRQIEQYGEVDIKIFQENVTDDKGFSWYNSIEGQMFWNHTILLGKFDIFFILYPKQPYSSIVPSEMNLQELTQMLYQFVYSSQFLGMGDFTVKLSNGLTYQQSMDRFEDYKKEFEGERFGGKNQFNIKLRSKDGI